MKLKINKLKIRLFTKQLRGYAANEIIKYAKDAEIDLVIMRTQKNSIIRYLTWGSVTTKVMDKLVLSTFLVSNNV